MKTYTSLYEITGFESGLIEYSDGTVEIMNWASVEGIPRTFIGGLKIGLGEDLTATRSAVPAHLKKAMQRYEQDEGGETSKTGFMAWNVKSAHDEISVVINKNWH